MKRVSIVFAGIPYLIWKGLSNIVEELDNVVIKNTVNDIHTIEDVLDMDTPDIIVTFNSRANIDLLKTNKIADKYPTIKWIGLMINKEDNSTFLFNESIFIDEGKDVILEKIQFCLNEIHQFKETSNETESLSERERNVLMLVAKGLTNKEIADKLFISTHTVITHRKNITRKLDIKSVAGLTVYAILNKLIDLNDLK